MLLRSSNIYVQYRSDIKTQQIIDYRKMGCLKSWNTEESKITKSYS